LGYYGATLGERNPEVVEAAARHAKKQPITGRPADLLKPEWDGLRSQALALKGCNGSDEDVLTYAMFPQVAPKFLATRGEGPKNRGQHAARGRLSRPRIGGQTHRRPDARFRTRHLRGPDRRPVAQGHRPARLSRERNASNERPRQEVHGAAGRGPAPQER